MTKYDMFIEMVKNAFQIVDLDDVPELDYKEFSLQFEECTIGRIKEDMYQFYKFYILVRRAAEQINEV